MTILRYTVADDKDLTNESSEYDSYNEARADAQERHGIVMMYTYEFDDSEMVCDFTDDDDTEPADPSDDGLIIVDYDEEGTPVYGLR